MNRDFPFKIFLILLLSGLVACSSQPENSVTSSPSSPSAAPSSPSPSPSESVPPSQSPRPQPTEEPNQTPLSMVCRGTTDTNVDFTVYYNRESGFSRAELRPQTSDNVLTSVLTYDGKNEQGQGIWRGNVKQMAEVVVIHLSQGAAQSGDEISLRYDQGWGRGSCR